MVESNTKEPEAGPLQHIMCRFREEFGRQVYDNWIKHLTPVKDPGGGIILQAPSNFICDHIRDNFFLRMQQICLLHEENLIALTCLATERNESSPRRQADNSSIGFSNRGQALESVPLDRRYNFDSFIVGKSNEFAYAAAKRVAEGNSIDSNPLFIYGPVGLGKTHLIHSIGWAIRDDDPEKSVVYISAEMFMYEFIQAIRSNSMLDFKNKFRSIDVLMIDDLQFLGGKEATQEEFFHTFNALLTQSRQVVISADKIPSDLHGLEERLRSRLSWGLIADINPAGYELRLSILNAKSEQLGFKLPKSVAEFLADSIDTNIRELEGCLKTLIAKTRGINQELTVKLSQELLRDYLRSRCCNVTIEDIQKQVVDFYGIRMTDLHSVRRSKDIVRARQVAMFLAKKFTSDSFPVIGRKFGGRDHSTVIHAVKAVGNNLEKDFSLQEDIDLLSQKLRGRRKK